MLVQKHPYYDLKSEKENPRWYLVDVQFLRRLKRFISLKELQTINAPELKDMVLLKKGRLSIQPVSKEEFDFILTLEEQSPEIQ